jgi:hypothetical protein
MGVAALSCRPGARHRRLEVHHDEVRRLGFNKRRSNSVLDYAKPEEYESPYFAQTQGSSRRRLNHEAMKRTGSVPECWIVGRRPSIVVTPRPLQATANTSQRNSSRVVSVREHSSTARCAPYRSDVN